MQDGLYDTVPVPEDTVKAELAGAGALLLGAVAYGALGSAIGGIAVSAPARCERRAGAASRARCARARAHTHTYAHTRTYTHTRARARRGAHTRTHASMHLSRGVHERT